MEPIRKGMTGPAVEDVQDRLASIDFIVDEAERAECFYGPSTAACISTFRTGFGLPAGTEVDSQTWALLVDESYQLGDRTLYLRLPNFHGRDVRDMQLALNVLGFSCGEVDGYFGAYTESAVKQFQESVGILADGMAFPNTIDAILRLKHVWLGKPAQGPHPTGETGCARAARVLETTPISIGAEDPISRNIAGRLWNLATATSDASLLTLAEDPDDIRPGDTALFIITTRRRALYSTTRNVLIDSSDAQVLANRIHTAHQSITKSAPVIRLQLTSSAAYDGSFTSRTAQSMAVLLLDAICLAFG